MKIITIRQPYASALLVGVYDAERRNFRMSSPTLIHAAANPGMQPKKAIEWLSSRDPIGAQALAWSLDGKGEMPGESPMSTVILDSIADYGDAFPFGRIIGYVEDWESVREGLEWANKPINPVHFPLGIHLPEHRGALGHLQCPESVVDLVRAWIPQT